MANWQVSGDYFETCNCDYLCPCIPSNLTAKATQGYCDFAMVFHINQPEFWIAIRQEQELERHE